MITKENQEKVKKFYQILAKTQLPPAKEIGLIVINKEKLADLSVLMPNPNAVSIF